MPAVQTMLFPDPRPLVERLGVDFFRQLLERPGVYLMQDAADLVLYVGKAKDLRKRLTSYRVANPDRLGRRHLRLLRQVMKIDALHLYLLGGAAKPVLSADAKADPRDWLPGEHSVIESIPIPAALAPGDYIVALTLIDPKAQHRPWRLAIAAPENEGRYEISTVKVE